MQGDLDDNVFRFAKNGHFSRRNFYYSAIPNSRVPLNKRINISVDSKNFSKNVKILIIIM